MKELLDAITDLVANSPPAKIAQLAEIVRKTTAESLPIRASDWPTSAIAKIRFNRFMKAIEGTECSAGELAGILVGSSHAYHREKAEEVVELVLTGPSSELVATRKTEQALLQVIQAAKSKLFMTSFVAYEVSSIIAALNKVMDYGVELSMLLESDVKDGRGLRIDMIGKMRTALPGARIYFWADKPAEFIGGKVHAKVAVADERLCFISSANLTGHAMEKNMEAGVLVDGGPLPIKLHRHLEALVTTNQLKLD